MGGLADWLISTDAIEGVYSAQSGDIGNGQYTDLSLTMDVLADDEISFYRKVSSENNYDYLEFYINGVLQDEWAGTVNWSQVSFPVQQGTRTFRWSYDKDGSVSTGQDCTWIDDIIFPPGGAVSDMGFIEGYVTLNGGAGNVEDVQITAGNYVAHPNSEGDYILPVTPGTYDVIASLIGYEPETSAGVVVVELQTTTVNFILESITILNPPENLVATVYENNVELVWDAPEELISDSAHRTKREELSLFDRSNLRKDSINKLSEEPANLRVLSGYKIYRNEEMIHEIADPLTTTYLDENLDGGEYTYYVVAVYDEGDSGPSNVQVVEIILPVPKNLSFLVMNENVNLNWQAPDTTIPLSGYNVYRDNEFLAGAIPTIYIDVNVPIGTHTYYVTALYGSYESGPSNEVVVEMTETDFVLTPLFTELSGNYPNPFNPETTINFALKDAGNVRIEIFNIKGKKVCTLMDGHLEADFHSIVWNGKDDSNKTVSSGIYFYKMNAGEKYTSTRKMILMK
ncbi:MAG: T9SS type A sorting domain-containing protein [Armatimonadetes bacterium]|nr:T9SS type A sorting domain-containing protein [Armatimonadota bacterium]